MDLWSYLDWLFLCSPAPFCSTDFHKSLFDCSAPLWSLTLHLLCPHPLTEVAGDQEKHTVLFILKVNSAEKYSIMPESCICNCLFINCFINTTSEHDPLIQNNLHRPGRGAQIWCLCLANDNEKCITVYHSPHGRSQNCNYPHNGIMLETDVHVCLLFLLISI